jgi:hypothetical protein
MDLAFAHKQAHGKRDLVQVDERDVHDITAELRAHAGKNLKER